jgi:hypothetical protein
LIERIALVARAFVVPPGALGLTTRMPLRAIIAGLIAGALAAPVAGAAPADADERAEALLLGGAINRFVAKQLPTTFTVRGNRDAGIGAEDVTLVEARFCGGAKDPRRGRFVGALRPAGASGGSLPALEASDCRGKLDDVAKRLAAAPDAGAVAVVELVVEWVPSELRVAIGDVGSAGEAARALARTLARAKAAGPLTAVQTGGLRLETERGTSLSLDLALSFPKGADGALATLTIACPDCASAPRAPLVTAAGAPADSDGVVGATLRFANRVVALFSEDGPLVLELDRQTVEIRNIQISGGEGALAVRGRATSRAVSESARVSIESSGADLRLAEVRAEPELEDCNALSGGASIRCNVRNAARGPAAAALAAAMTSRYRGKLLRTLVAPPPFSFDVGGRRMTLRLTPTRASATAGNVIVHGKADVE